LTFALKIALCTDERTQSVKVMDEMQYIPDTRSILHQIP
jgi:hypothetical protein